MHARGFIVISASDTGRNLVLKKHAWEGFKEVVTVTRERGGSLGMHMHPFETKALMFSDELQLRAGDEDRCYRVGQVFHLLVDAWRSEQYVPECVAWLVERRLPSVQAQNPA